MDASPRPATRAAGWLTLGLTVDYPGCVLRRVLYWISEFLAGHTPLVIAVALGIFVLSFLAGIAVILGLPADYFVRKPEPPPKAHRVLRASLRVGRNLLGYVMFVSGFVMALPLVPGPGVLFMIIGIGLADFPGKHALKLRLLRQRHVLGSANQVRARFGQPPLQTKGSDEQSVVNLQP